MDQAWLLALALGVLAVVLGVWVTREAVLRRRRRRRSRPDRPDLDSALAGLAPLVTQPLASLVDMLERQLARLQPSRGPDGTVTLLFSDIVGSMKLNRKLGDRAWVRVLKAHDKVVKSTAAAKGGTVVKNLGDGFMAAFPTPREAVDCALAIAPALDANDEIGVTLELRMGIHTGAAISAHGDYHGTNVAMAARVAECAHSREVLVTGEVYERLRDDRGLRFRARRRTRVKGVPGRHRFYAVSAR